MRKTHSSFLALVLASAAVVGACGGGPATDAKTPPPSGTTVATTTATGDTPPPASATAVASASATGVEPPPAVGPSRPIDKSKLLADVAKLGIDMKKPPTLEKLPLAQKKKLMPLFRDALGYKECTGCHAADGDKIDYKKDTRHLQITRKMWNEFVSRLKLDGGDALFCDSCHGGSEHVLNRSDKKVLNDFMTAEYEGKLSRHDGEEHSCSTCHTTEFEPKIITKLWGIK